MKASEYFQGAIGGIFDLIFGIGGDGRRWSSAEHYDTEESTTPDIHIHGNLHTDQGATVQSGAAPASLDQMPVIANALALQEGFAAANDNPVHEMRAPEYPPMPSPVAHDYTPAAPVYPPAPSYSDLCAKAQEAAFNHAIQEEDQGIRM